MMSKIEQKNKSFKTNPNPFRRIRKKHGHTQVSFEDPNINSY